LATIHRLEQIPFESRRGWEVIVEFTLDPLSEYEQDFLNLSKEFVRPRFWLFGKKDVEHYLTKENERESYSELLKVRIPPASLYMTHDTDLEYDEDTNVFTFHNWITDTPTTRGAIEEISSFKDKIKNVNARFEEEYYLLQCIMTLALFWD